MGPPEALVVRADTFPEWMCRGGELGGQNKVPRVILDPGLLHDLTDLARGRLAKRGPDGA